MENNSEARIKATIQEAALTAVDKGCEVEVDLTLYEGPQHCRTDLRLKLKFRPAKDTQ